MKLLQTSRTVKHVISTMHDEIGRVIITIEGEGVSKELDPKDIVYNCDLKKKDLEGFAKTFDNTPFNPNDK